MWNLHEFTRAEEQQVKKVEKLLRGFRVIFWAQLMSETVYEHEFTALALENWTTARARQLELGHFVPGKKGFLSEQLCRNLTLAT